MMKYKVTYSVRSHVGLRRENNEDNLFADGVILPPGIGTRAFSLDGVTGVPSIFAVCDGMGGEDVGETASLAAMETLQADRARLCRAPPKQLSQAIQQFVEQAHHTIQDRTAGRRSGATLALTVFTSSGIFCFNLGDSRVYCMRSGYLRQITNDHSVAAEQLRRGILPPKGAPPDHRVTRCIGIGTLQPAEAYPTIKQRCRMLICSDGLTDMVNDETLANILSTAAQPSAAADQLIRAALLQGGQDNITVIVLDTNGPGHRFL